MTFLRLATDIFFISVTVSCQQVGDASSTDIIIQHMNRYGRICCCGAISQYNSAEPPSGKLKPLASVSSLDNNLISLTE